MCFVCVCVLCVYVCVCVCVCVQLIEQVLLYCWSYCEQDGVNGLQITGSFEMYAALKAELLFE